MNEPQFKLAGWWNGQPTATFTACIVKLLPNIEKPFWWQNAFPNKEIQAIEITYNNTTWLIANDDGTGYYKVTEGMGSPQVYHAGFEGHEFVRYISASEVNSKVNEELLAENERIIEEYQKQTDPAEYERMQSLIASLRKFQAMTPDEKVKHIQENNGI